MKDIFLETKILKYSAILILTHSSFVLEKIEYKTARVLRGKIFPSPLGFAVVIPSSFSWLLSYIHLI